MRIYKKLFLITFVGLLPHSFVFSQKEAGSISVMGTVSFDFQSSSDIYNATKTSTGSSSNITLAPAIEYFLNPSLSIIGEIGYNHTSNTDVVLSDKTTTNMISISPKIRKYFMLGEKVGIIAQGSISFGFGSENNINTNTSEVLNTLSLFNFSMGIAPGIYFELTKKLSLDATWGFFGYNLTRQKNTTGIETITSSSDFSFNNISLSSFSLGVCYDIK